MIAPRIYQKSSTFNLKSIEYANYIVKSKYCEIKYGLICLWNDMVALKLTFIGRVTEGVKTAEFGTCR